MTKRLDILLDDDEWHQIQRLARQQGVPPAEWVRRSLLAARDAESGAHADQKLAAIRTAARHAFPTADIDRMLDEIERGHTPA